MIRLSAFLFIAAVFSYCNDESYYDKGFYERISNIKIPTVAHAIESIDNSEFVTTTVFVADSLTLKKFIRTYGFGTNLLMPHLLGNSYLRKNKTDSSTLTSLYYEAGTKGKNSWLYIVDLKHEKLWAEIQYPDFGGN